MSGECISVFARLEPHLAKLRELTKRPKILANLESLVMRQPDAKEMLAVQREMRKKWLQTRTDAAAK